MLTWIIHQIQQPSVVQKIFKFTLVTCLIYLASLWRMH
jgi:hypothetical protein